MPVAMEQGSRAAKPRRKGYAVKVIGRLLVSALGFSVGIGLASAALADALEIRWGDGPARGGATSANGSAGKRLYIAKGGGGGGGGWVARAGAGGAGRPVVARAPAHAPPP